jgi:hypothetical protein
MLPKRKQSMDFLAEFKRVDRAFKSDFENYERLYPVGFPVVMYQLGLLIFQLEEDSRDQEKLERISSAMFRLIDDSRQFSVSPIGNELLQILNEFIKSLEPVVDKED